MATVLLVEDDPAARQGLELALRRLGYGVRAAETGEAALSDVRDAAADVVVLDVMLPGLDGFEVCRRLRRGSDIPVIMLTARGDDLDIVGGLEAGADDYVVKPVEPRVLDARIRAVLRRTEAARLGVETIRVGELTVDVPRMQVSVGRRAAALTSTEFQILVALARQPGRIFTRGQLLDQVHGVAFESYERAIDAHIKNIRRKLEPDPRRPRYILTVYGMGYKLAEE